MTPGLTLLGRGAEYIDVAVKRNWGQRPLNSILANPAAVRPILQSEGLRFDGDK